MDGDANDGVDEAIAGELALMDPAVRACRARFERLLDPDETRLDGRRTRRSSLWRRRSGETGWRMYYHQGTPVPPGAE
ncbi:hypothetical protein ABZT34_05355 [Streptomyces sp. NPDC005329]|uniref:hypothetical protein n=1 Tax=Streptomyces sp. NPDC005329 TaxID=3157034 RepID=UPI0033BEA750